MKISEAGKWALDIAERILKRQPSMSWNAAQIYFFQFLAIALGLLSGIIIARFLGPKEKGVYDLYVLLGGFISEIGTLGFGNGLLYYLLSQRRPLAEAHGTALVFSVLIGVVTAALGFLGLFFWQKSFPNLSEWMILLCFLSAPFLYYRVIWGNMLLGIDKPVLSYQYSFLLAALLLAGIVILWQTNQFSASTVVILNAVTLVIITVGGAAALRAVQPRLSFNVGLAKESLTYGWIFFIGYVANILHFKVDQVMVNHWLGTEAVGIYAVSVRWAEMLFTLDTGIVAATFYAAGSANKRESYDMTLRHAKLTIAIIGGVGILLAIAAYPLIYFLYGEAYLGAALPLVCLIPGIAAWSSGKMLSRYISYNQGNMLQVTAFSIVGLLVNIALNFFFIPTYGLLGAALSSSASYLAVIILTIFAYRQLKPPDYAQT